MRMSTQNNYSVFTVSARCTHAYVSRLYIMSIQPANNAGEREREREGGGGGGDEEAEEEEE